jgi:tRNA(Ile)-lysidine synthase
MPTRSDIALVPPAILGRPVVVGFSGGLDSTVLLHLLAHTPATREAGLHALHVYHGLHDEADAWQAHCRRVCAALGVPLAVTQVQVAQPSPLGREGAAREARHAAFVQAVGEGEVLALAHHRDDQAETFLLRSLRASGPDGLAAMRAWRAFGPGWMWRPLLAMPRDALRDYAHAHGLEWIEDDSNGDATLDRNFLRQAVMPLLRERWLDADASLARAAQLQAEAIALLQTEDAQALASVRTADPAVIRATALLAHPIARRARVLRAWIASLHLPPLPAQGIAHIESDLLHARADADAAFGWAGAVVRSWQGLLHAGALRAPLPPHWSMPWNLETPLTLPGGASLVLEGDVTSECEDVASRFALPLRVHGRRGGERITLPGRSHSHALKHVLQDLRVPPWERVDLPLVSDAHGTLLAVADFAYAADFDAWLRERGARLVWTPATPALPL